MEERIGVAAGSMNASTRKIAICGEGQAPAHELVNWIYEEPRLRILAHSDGEIIWMSRAAEALSPAGFPFAPTGGEQGEPRRRLEPTIVSQLAPLTDQRPHYLVSTTAPDWVIWAQSIPVEDEHGPQAFVGLTLRRRGEAPELEALAEACHLTRAEVRIIAALMAGQDTATVAHSLGISMHTLRTHVRHAYRKLGVTTREGLFAGALAFMHP